MKPQNMINMVKRYTDQYGVNVSWQEPIITTNSRGIPVKNGEGELKSEKVLLLKEKFNPMKIIDTNIIGLSQDYTRYILTLPEIEIKKDMVITDNHSIKWKLGFIDWFDISGTAVCKQASLIEVQ
jgi:hypothetical protein